MRKTNIILEVSVSEKNGVEGIRWKSDDPPSNGNFIDAKAFFLSLFDSASLDTMKIDLWTNKLQVGEMQRLTYFSLKSLSETYHRATKDDKMANDLARFCQYFGEETGIITK